MSSSKSYRPLDESDTPSSHPLPHPSSTALLSDHGSTTPARYTPDSYSDEDHGVRALDDLEAEEGLRPREFRPEAGGVPPEHAPGGVPRDVEEEDETDMHPDGDAERSLLSTRRSGRRRSSVKSFELYTPDEERTVRRKLDVRLVLFVALLYMLSFLDRSNIGNAKVAGMVEDLHLSDSQYQVLLSSFYLAYIAFEWMTLCYKIFPPHIYISCCVLAWGFLASLQSVATSFPFLIVLRVSLGIGEAAFVGIPFYLSFFFRREELAFRTGLFVSAAPLATTFAGTLAWAIIKFGDNTGIASWRLLFLVEGFPACVVAIWAWWWIPDSPSTARWLTPRERKIAALRMRDEVALSLPPREASKYKSKFQWSQVRRTLTDPVSYLTASMFFCCNVAFSSMPIFLPTIVNDMGFSPLASEGLSAPPFFFAFLSVLMTALISDRAQSRSIPIVVNAAISALGYLFLAIAGILQIDYLPRYLAVFLICAGFFGCVVIVVTWTVNNQATDEGKGTGMAVLNMIGQAGPLIGTRLYPDSEGPYFVKGMSICAGSMALVGVLALVLRFVLRRRNNAKQDGAFIYIT